MALSANWKTKLWGTITAASTSIVGLCVAINQAATPTGGNDIDPFVQTLLYAIPARYRFWLVFISSGVSAFALQRFAHHAKDKDVTGGSVQQTLQGAPAKEGTQTLVDITKQSSPPPQG